MPRTNEINNGMNNSNTIVASTRNEIRTSEFAVVTSIAASFRNFYCKNTLAITFLMVIALSVCYTLGFVLPWYVALPYIIVASCSVLRSLVVILYEAMRFSEGVK